VSFTFMYLEVEVVVHVSIYTRK